MSLYPLFARPRSLDQAAALLDATTGGAVIIAGGQEIMPHVNYGVLQPDVYLDIGALKELRGVEVSDSELAIGALTVHRDLQQHQLIKEQLPLLAFAASQVGGGWQVHNRGTIGGNIVIRHPLYDIVPALMALDARIELAAASETRQVALDQWIAHPGNMAGEILTRVLVAPMPSDAHWCYEKLKSTSGSYGSANCAAIVQLSGEKITGLKVIIGATTELPVDASAALTDCLGQELSNDLEDFIQKSCTALITEALSDHQGDAQWRRAMAGVVARRAVRAAINTARRSL